MKIEFDLDLEELKNELVQFITDKCINDLSNKIIVETAKTIKIDLENNKEFKKKFHKEVAKTMFDNLSFGFKFQIEEYTRNLFKEDFKNFEKKSKIEILEELLRKAKKGERK